jgi:hypothetical protein
MNVSGIWIAVYEKELNEREKKVRIIYREKEKKLFFIN